MKKVIFGIKKIVNFKMNSKLQTYLSDKMPQKKVQIKKNIQQAGGPMAYKMPPAAVETGASPDLEDESLAAPIATQEVGKAPPRAVET